MTSYTLEMQIRISIAPRIKEFTLTSLRYVGFLLSADDLVS